MLFQPTNILPDVINGIANGTVDVTSGLVVSWQVNGNSKMTAYEIVIYENDTASTQKYTTGKVTLDTPFCGVAPDGTIQRFSATKISSSTLSAAGITNGNQYKINITQYYNDGSGTQTGISQTSLSVFLARSNPVVQINDIGTDGVVGTRTYTFTGTYAQSDGDSLTWVRWRLFNRTQLDDGSPITPVNIYDTGRLYGVLQLEFNYDGLLNDDSYTVELSLETSSGVQVIVTKNFSVSWEETELENVDPAIASRVNCQSSAVRVEWGNVDYIYGATSPEVYIQNGLAVLPYPGSEIQWGGSGDDALGIGAPWVFVMRTKITPETSTIAAITMSDGNTISLTYDLANRIISCTNLRDYSMASYNVFYTIAIGYNPNTNKHYLMVLAEDIPGNLLPSSGLTPSESLVPNELNHSRRTIVFPTERTMNQYPIDKISVYGKQNIDYIQVISGENADWESIDSAIKGWFFQQYNPDGFRENTYFYADFADGSTNAGSFSIDGQELKGWAIYREQKNYPVALHIADVSLVTSKIYDYGCANRTEYRYLIYPIGATKNITAALKTDWIKLNMQNWSILEASKQSTGVYKVINEYLFGKNLNTGSVSNNNNPAVHHNFTRYATVQMSNVNYQSGTLTSLIGGIGYQSYVVQDGDTLDNIAYRFGTTSDEIYRTNPHLKNRTQIKAGTIISVYFPNNPIGYRDDKTLRDMIWALSTTSNNLFLKNKKGDVIEIKTAGEITVESPFYGIRSPISASVPWVQVGAAENLSIIGLYDDITNNPSQTSSSLPSGSVPEETVTVIKASGQDGDG